MATATGSAPEGPAAGDLKRPIRDQLPHDAPHERGGDTVQGDAAQVHVVVGLLAGGGVTFP